MRRIILGLFFCSGACSLIVEVVWMRLLRDVIGASLPTATTVLATFMGGLALGSWLGGRRMPHRLHPLRVYGLLELGIGVSAAAMPQLVHGLATGYLLIAGPLADHGILTLLIRVGLSATILLIPTTLMGATLPVLSRMASSGTAKTHEPGRTARWGSWLYAVNTYGAVVGTLGAGFVLLPALGLARTNSLAAGLTLLVGLTAFWLARHEPVVAVAPSSPPFSPFQGERLMVRGNPDARRVIWVAGLSGCSALSAEVIWFNALSLITYDTAFAVTAMLAAFLTGIAIGGAIGANRRGDEHSWWRGLAICQAGLGLYAWLSPWLIGVLNVSLGRHYDIMSLSGMSWELVFLVKPFLMAGALMILPTVLMGLTMALAFKTYPAAASQPASGIGAVYAGNTVGAILGASLTGLVVIPTIGSTGALAGAASLNWLAAIIAQGRGRIRLISAAIGGLLVLGISGALSLLPVDVFFGQQARRADAVVFQQQDATALVEVVQDEDGARTLLINRLYRWGSTTPAMGCAMTKQGLLPLLLHPHPESVIEIGVGTGIQFAPVLRDERVKAAHLVEISPAVVRAATWFSDANYPLLAHPKLALRVDDGRHDLRLRPTRYDLIILGLFTPYAPGAGSLFSQELYTLCRRRLNAGGLVVHWLPLHQMTPEGLKSAMHTFQSVFPQLSVWERDQYVALVGHPHEVSVDVTRLAEILRLPSLASTAASCELDNPTRFLASFLMGPQEAAAFAGDAPLNTEDHPRIEFSRLNLAQAHFYGLASDQLEALLGARVSPVRLLQTLEPSDLARVERAWTAHGEALLGAIHQVRGKHEAASEYFRRAQAFDPDEPIARSELPKYQ